MYCLIVALLGLTITLNGTQIWCRHPHNTHMTTPKGTTSTVAHSTTSTTAITTVSITTDEVSEISTAHIKNDNETTSTVAHSTTSTTAVTTVSITTDKVSEISTTHIKNDNETKSLSVSESTSITTSTLTITENALKTTIPSTASLNKTTTLPVSNSTLTTKSIPAMMTDTNTALESTTPSKTTTLLLSDFTSSAAYTSKPSTGTATSRSSIILYLASGSVAVFFVMIVVGVIVIIRYKRRINRLKTSIEVIEGNSKRKSRRSSTDLFGYENMAMHDIVDNIGDCQTVAHIPRITRGSVENAVSVHPGNYSYAFTPYDRSVETNNDASALETKPIGLFKSCIKLSKDEEDTCHPYFRLEPEIRAAPIESSTDDSPFVANNNIDVVSSNAVLPIHVYNHIKLGQGKTECDGDSGVLCSDQYSHISISDDTVLGKRQYYNIVNIQRARIESVDNYCHVGQNDTSIEKHVPRDDYDHVAM